MIYILHTIDFTEMLIGDVKTRPRLADLNIVAGIHFLLLVRG